MKILGVLFVLVFLGSANGQDEVVPFGVEIKTCLPRSFVWNDFDQALRDSQRSELWPHDSSQVLGQGILLEGTEISVTYYFNFFIQPTYNYKIINVVPGQQFRYEATPDHPFRGGANLEFLDDGMGSRLVWVGEYLISENQDWAKKAFLNFSEDFFNALAVRFKEAEKTRCGSSAI
jgi:hypothetical protein